MAGALSSMADLSAQSFERILLVKPSSLGDVIHALPVLHGLRARYPTARIDWLVSSSFAPLLAEQEEIDEIILFDRRRFGRMLRSPTATRDFVGFIRRLRARRYDLVVDLQGLFRSGFISRACGAPIRIGFADAREGATMFYTHRLEIEDPDLHAVDRNIQVGQLLGFGDLSVQFNLTISRAHRSDVRRWLSEMGMTGDENLVVVVPGARWETKVWLPERFAETINHLQGTRDVRCVLLGSRDEMSLCARIAAMCRSAPVNLAGQTSLPQLAALISLADVVLCQDSAAMHLAVALDRPLVCITGPTDPRRTGPYRRLDDVVRLDLECTPCFLRRLSQCRHGHRCMHELSVQTVVDAVERTRLEEVAHSV